MRMIMKSMLINLNSGMVSCNNDGDHDEDDDDHDVDHDHHQILICQD